MSIWSRHGVENKYRSGVARAHREQLEISGPARSVKVQKRLTTVHNAVRMQVLDRAHDGPDELGGVFLEEVRLGADPVKEFTTLAEIGDEVDLAR